MDWFIDRLTVHQEYPEGGLPVVGKHGILRHDIATGERLSDTVNSRQHEGSYSSSVQIRCTGSSVTVSGNPSRFNRSDNLWGFTTIEQCMQVYNQILAEYDLPPFARCTGVWHGQSPDGKRARMISDGAVIRHIDWTRNHAVGQGREHAFLRGASTLTIGRGLQPHLYPNGATVDWGTHRLRVRGQGSSYRYDKLYIKAHDLETHRDKRLKGASREEITYYDRLIEYCKDCGIVREEQSKKAPFLKKHLTLAFYGLTSEQDFRPHLTDIETALKRLEVNHVTYETIAEQLIAKGICTSSQSANATESYALKWLHGTPLDRSKSQYHVHRGRLLQLGLDISMPHDISRLPPQVRSSEVIDLKPAVMPSWYRLPRVAQLKAA
ncbi:phage/plasmid replication protein [Pseudohaliea sp.]|jgi:hypothetical protein|uniref:phage/plasmid replication domain-containing protein n=1 Tax=Pseudohaliea sp. TaxID=2740289 RepID=UPI0032EDDD33